MIQKKFYELAVGVILKKLQKKLLYKKLSKYNKPKSGEKYFKYICFSSPLVGAGSEHKLVLIENFLVKVIKKVKKGARNAFNECINL